jgi:hypothetical protein
MKSIILPRANAATILAIIGYCSIGIVANNAVAQLAPPPPPIPFEANNSFFSGTVNVATPQFISSTNTNNIVAPGTIIAPVTFSGTVNDIDSIVQTYSRRTKLWTLNYVGGTVAVQGSTILSNLVVGDPDGDGESLDTTLTGWTFGAQVMPMDGSLMTLEMYKIVNGVVLRQEPVTGINLNFMSEPALRSGTIGYNVAGDVTSLNAVTREPVDVYVMSDVFTYQGDPDAINFILTGVFSNTITSKTNTWVESPGVTNTNSWFSPTGQAAIQGLGR